MSEQYATFKPGDKSMQNSELYFRNQIQVTKYPSFFMVIKTLGLTTLTNLHKRKFWKSRFALERILLRL